MKNKNRHFDLTLPWEDGEIRVTGYLSKYYPAVMYLRNGDPGYPAEGREIEDFQAFAFDGSELEDSDGEIQEALTDAIFESLEDDGDCGPDPDDARDRKIVGD